MSDTTPDAETATGTGVEPTELETMIGQLDGAIESITDKIETGRIRDPETEQVRIKYFRTLGYLLRTKRKLVEDQTLSDLADEVEALKAAQRDADGGDGADGNGDGDGKMTLRLGDR